MIKEICPPSQCTGCYACFNIWPGKAVEMIPGAIGFYRPRINERCTECGVPPQKLFSGKATEIDYDKGVSMGLFNTEKGLALFERVKDRFACFDRTVEDAVAKNPCLSWSMPKPQKAVAFQADLAEHDFAWMLEKYPVPVRPLRQKLDIFWFTSGLRGMVFLPKFVLKKYIKAILGKAGIDWRRRGR